MNFISQQEDLHQNPPEACSLRGGTLLPGDVLWVPAGTLVFEKSTKEHNIGIRSMSLFLHGRSVPIMDIVMSVHKQKLVLIS